MEDNVLGRGLGVLMKGVANEGGGKESKSNSIEQLFVEDIHPNKEQPRTHFDDDNIESLKLSIQEKGILQPIIVRPLAAGYQIIAGERRYRACKSLGIRYIPAIVKEASDVDTLEIALIENIHRKDLGIIEKARSYRDLMENYGYTHEDLSKKLGVERSTISNTVRLLRLPLEVVDLLDCGDIPFSVGRLLLSLESEEEQIQVCDYYLKKRLSVRELDSFVKKVIDQGHVPEVEEEIKVDPNIVALRERLVNKLGTKVDIRYNPKKGKGKIIIHCDNLEDFDRFVEGVQVPE